MGLNRGRTSPQYWMTSTTRRIDGSMGNTHAPRAPNSLSRSFCTVPAIRAGATPCFSATAWYIASSTGAVALMVNEVVTWSSGIPAKISSMSASESIATPTRPTSPCASGASES